MTTFHLRNMRPEDREEVARLIYHSTNRYYQSIGRDKIFKGDELSAAVFFDVYERLDPGQGIVAVDNESGQIVGSCFVHPRETHVSLGIMNAHPDYFGRGVARAILNRIIELAKAQPTGFSLSGISSPYAELVKHLCPELVEAQHKPVRLVSSCFNLDSYSLYTRAGFVPFCTFQDMYLSVPQGGLTVEPPPGVSVREGVEEDVKKMQELELAVSGISRVNDYQYFLKNEDGLWHVSVIDSPDGGLDGFLVSCRAEACNMLGPGVARTEQQAAALIHAELNQHPGRSPVFLVPVTCKQLVQQLYAWGAKNCELHVAQVYGYALKIRGVVMPTFLPESG